MSLQLIYDEDVDVLRVFTGEDETTSSSLTGLEEVVVDLDGAKNHVVGIMVMGASAYLPLGKRGYDPQTDTLTLGAVVSDPAKITHNSNIVTYWQPDRYEPDRHVEPVGVAIRQASKHLNGILK